MKNFIQRETLAYEGPDLEDYCRFLAAKFISIYPQVEGVQVSATEIPYSSLSTGSAAFCPAGPERASARIEINRDGVVEVASGLRGYRLLRLGGSAFQGFVRDEYTTLPDIHNRPLHMWMDLEWTYMDPSLAFCGGVISAAIRKTVREVFESFESGSIQQVIYQMGTRILAEQTSLAEVHQEANNRTWDTVTERGQGVGIFTDARPPYGCLGLRLRR
jgi:urate oxidase/2-oxo-4-hydroxy-4-carboxy-5-ureidoimidazoline decarboxylase